MPLQDTPFGRITRTSRWLNLALFGILPLVLVLGSALFWGLQRIIEQERERLNLDFTILIGYVHAQEQFLNKLRSHSPSLPAENTSTTISLHATSVRERFGMQLLDGQHSSAEMAFSLACGDPSDCPTAGRRLAGLGGYLANFYSTYWASSYFPASTSFLVNQNDSISLSVPAVDAPSGYEMLTPRHFLAATDAIRAELRQLDAVQQRLIDQDLPGLPGPASAGRIHWFRTAELPGSMLGMIYANVPPSAWSGRPGTTPAIYAATLLSHHRISIFEKAMSRPLYGGFWLSHREAGILLGDGDRPRVSENGLHYTADGLVLRTTDSTGVWTGVYRVDYPVFFQDNLWLPITAALLLLLSLGGGFAFVRWFNRSVIAPAQNAQHKIVEREEFSRTLVETAPVALCLLARPTGDIVFGNGLALQWLGVEAGQPLENTPEANLLLRQVLAATAPGTIANFHAADGRPLYVAYAPTRYNNRDVVLCAFSDISARASIERALAQAKREADKASEAKSTFLATMSHEIRTPLYGVLGTLELMGLTQLDREQRQHLERMQSSSAILLQLISDILDITKIEAGQLVLESTEFNPRELVQSCTSSYAAMAEQKGLLLFCCVDIDVPPWVTGDAARIRQILGNLLSNAIKFSESGHVIARLKVASAAADQTTLTLQVVDTGIGIGKDEQTQLFVPFYQIDGASHTVRGTGIGLPICARLAKLMGSEIRVTSELGLGSSFSLELPLRTVPGRPLDTPDLRGARVLVRSPNRELTDNVCLWLNLWGAQAAPAPAPLPLGAPDEVLLDVLFSGPDLDALDWGGHHVLAAAGVKAPSARTIRVIPGVDQIAAGILGALRGQLTPPPGAAEAIIFAPLGLRVLVAEDNPINQATLQNQLQQLGCTATVAPNGAEALTLWGLGTYDVLLTDVNMPRMNGYDLARELRAQGVKVPIIGVTANAMREEEERCLDAGMTSWLVKPIELRTLRRHLQHRNAGASGIATAMTRLLPAAASTPPPASIKFRALFITTMQDDLEQLEQTLAAGDLHLLQKTLHRIRGAVGVVHMTALTRRLEALEAALHNEGLNAVTFSEAQALAGALRRMLAEI
ncbi:hybrid sensor histidine kinase/response regulator [Achromobacter xylosoxidans]|uniref:hybrid sensor histidine kinase/response regulator n=1 Tax=Alcaligenes xylosoxydans xylosoxydans TaxID=85698 RepID=UPI001CB97F40|nr:hybrid sensor histidine kinase/response regulator [Achromobacter xylosoxidans]